MLVTLCAMFACAPGGLAYLSPPPLSQMFPCPTYMQRCTGTEDSASSNHQADKEIEM